MESGSWVESARFGRAVLLREEKQGWYSLRYEATHTATGETLWVYNCDDDVTFLDPPDNLSRYVLTLKGPYGKEP